MTAPDMHRHLILPIVVKRTAHNPAAEDFGIRLMLFRMAVEIGLASEGLVAFGASRALWSQVEIAVVCSVGCLWEVDSCFQGAVEAWCSDSASVVVDVAVGVSREGTHHRERRIRVLEAQITERIHEIRRSPWRTWVSVTAIVSGASSERVLNHM